MPTSRFEVYVVPRSSRPGPDGRYGGVPRLRIAAPPVDGRANREVCRALKEMLQAPVRLVGGGTNRTKHLETELATGALAAALERVFGPVTE